MSSQATPWGVLCHSSCGTQMQMPFLPGWAELGTAWEASLNSPTGGVPTLCSKLTGALRGLECHSSFLSYRGQATATSPCPPVPQGGRHWSSWPPKASQEWVEDGPTEVLSGGAQASLKASV